MITTLNERTDLLYRKIASNIEEKIKQEVLQIGDKIPSIRSICRDHGVSMSTALQAYFELEKKGLIESRPQSGYYVSYAHNKFLATPATSKPVSYCCNEDSEELIDSVMKDITNTKMTLFSLGVPSADFLPVAKLNKAMIAGMRDVSGSGSGYDHIQGNNNLRRQIARLSLNWNGRLHEDDIITTAGCMNALSFCLMALTTKGDTIAVESPVYFGILQLASSLGLKVLEQPTNAVTGIDIDALKKAVALKKIQVVVLISNFQNPLGCSMPNEHKKEVVKFLEENNIPLIEDDLYGDVYFDDHRPANCKSFDTSGNVLLCSSVSKTLAPGYRVGWVAPGKHKEKILRLKLYHSISSSTLPHHVIGTFLETGRYDHHLRKLRQTLYTNCLQYLRCIKEYFPDDTKVTRPKGGFMLWVELNKKANTVDVFEKALRQNISIAPGKIFTLQKQYNNCMRMSYGIPWTDKIESSIKTLGKIIKAQSI